MAVKLRNYWGLAAVFGTVAGLIGTGILMPVSVWLALPFIVIALLSFAGFVVFIYRFVFFSPHLELTQEDMVEPATAGDAEEKP